MNHLGQWEIIRNGDFLLAFRAEDSSLVDFSVSSNAGNPSGEIERILQSRFGQSISLNSVLVENHWCKPRLSVSALNMNLTERCNLACVYCYAKGGNYARIQGEMKPDQARDALRKAFSRADPEIPFRIEFFGGEPLLNPSTIASIIELQDSWKAWRNHPAGTRNRISTNLTVLTPEMTDQIEKGRMTVSVSIDGGPEVQDTQRPFKNGAPSFETIFANVEKIRNRCPAQTIVARMTVFRHPQTLSGAVREFAESGLFDYVSIYPAAVSPKAGEEHGESFFSTEFREQFLSIVRNYPNILQLGRFKGILEVNRYAQSILTGQAAVNHCRAGAGYFTVSPDGSVHPCHRLIGNTDWNLGRFDWGPETASLLLPWQTPVGARPICRDCHLRYLCGGGCKQQALIATGNLLGHDPSVCAFSHLLFESAITVATHLTGAVRTRLAQSFRELPDLFVLCGQVTLDNGRQPVLLVDPASGAAFRRLTLEGK